MYNKKQIWRHKIPLSTRLVESVFSLQLSTSELVKSTLLPTKIPTPPLPKTGKDRPRFSYMNISITVHRIPSCIFSYNFNICGIFFHVMKLCRHVKNMTVTSALCESWRKMKKMYMCEVSWNISFERVFLRVKLNVAKCSDPKYILSLKLKLLFFSRYSWRFLAFLFVFLVDREKVFGIIYYSHSMSFFLIFSTKFQSIS